MLCYIMLYFQSYILFYQFNQFTMNISTCTPYLKISQQTITQNQNQTTTRFTPYKFLNSQNSKQENQHIQAMFQINDVKQFQIKNIPELYQKIKQFQMVMKDSTDKRKALIQDMKISFQKLSQLKQNIMNFSQYLDDNVFSEIRNEFKQPESQHALQSVYTLKQFKKNQFLTQTKKMERAKIICKETEYLNLQLFIQNSSDQKKFFYFEQNKKQYSTKDEQLTDLEKLFQNQKLKKNKVKLRTIQQHENWTAFTLQAVNFLFRFYKHFKKVTGFYPPKLQKKYIIYNFEKQYFSIQASWIINWILGVIDQPMSLQQKFAFKEFPTPTDKDDQLLPQKRESFDITLESQNLNPLIYVTLSQNPSQKNYETFKVNIQNKDENYAQKQKKQNQLTQIMKLIDQISRKKKLFTSQSQLLLQKIKNKIKKQQIDQKVAIYNLLMTIYSLVRLQNFDFLTNLNNLQKWKNNNKSKDQLENKRKKQNQSLSFQQKKVLFVFQFLQSKEIQQAVVNQMFYYPPEFVINGWGISYFQYFQQIVITQLKNEIPRIKSQPHFYLSLAKNLCHPDCYLMIASNNAIRYIATCLIGQFFKIQRRLMELFFGANYSTFQIDKNSQQSKPSPVQKISQEQQKKAKQNQIILNILKYKKLSFQKLTLYKESNTQLIENNKVVTSTARTIFRYVQQLEKTDFQKKTQNQLKEIQTKIISHLMTFLKDFIFNFKMLKYKQLQTSYIFRKINPINPKQKIKQTKNKKQNQRANNSNNINPNNNELQRQIYILNKVQIIGFVLQAINLNFSFLKLFNQLSSRSCCQIMSEPQYKITTQMVQIINSNIILINNNFIDFSKINTTQLQLQKYQKKNEQKSTKQISQRIIKNNIQLIQLQKKLIQACINIQFCYVKDAKNKNKRLGQIGVQKINFFGLNICKGLVEILKNIQKEKPQYLDQLNLWKECFVDIYQTKKQKRKQIELKISQNSRQQTHQILGRKYGIESYKQQSKEKISSSSYQIQKTQKNQINQQLSQQNHKGQLLAEKSNSSSLQQLQMKKIQISQKEINQNLNQKLYSELQSRGHLYLAIIKNICYVDSFVFMASFNAIRYIASCMIASLFQIEVLLVEMQMQMQKKVKFQKSKVFQQINSFKEKSIEKLLFYKENRNEMLQNNKVVTTKAKSYVDFIEKNLKDLKGFNLKKAVNVNANDHDSDKKFLLKTEAELGKLIIIFFKDFILNYKMLKYKQLQIEYQKTQTDLKQLTLQEHIRGSLLEIFFINYGVIKILNDVQEICKQSYFAEFNLNIKNKKLIKNENGNTNGKERKDLVIREDIISIIQRNILVIPVGSLRKIKSQKNQNDSDNNEYLNDCLNDYNYFDFQQLRQSTTQDKIAQIRRNILFGCEQIQKILQKQKFFKKNKDQSYQKNFLSLELKKNMKEVLQKSQKTNPSYLNSSEIWKTQIQNNQDTTRKLELQQYNKQTKSTQNQKTSPDEIKQLQEEVKQKALGLKRGVSELQHIKQHVSKNSSKKEEKIKSLNVVFLNFMISLTNSQNSFLFLFQNIDRYLFLILFSQLYQKLKQYSKGMSEKGQQNNLNHSLQDEDSLKIQKRLKKFRKKAIQKISQFKREQSYKQIQPYLQKEVESEVNNGIKNEIKNWIKNGIKNEKEIYNQKDLKQKKHKHRCRFISKQFEIFKFIMKIIKNEQKQEEEQLTQKLKSSFDTKNDIKILMKYIAKVSETIFFNESTMKLKSKQIMFQLNKQERNLNVKKLEGKQKSQNKKNQKDLFILNSINRFRFQMVLLNYQIMNIFANITQNFRILDIGLQEEPKKGKNLNLLGEFVQKYQEVQNNNFEIKQKQPKEALNSNLQQKEFSLKKYQEKSISTSPSYSPQFSQKITIWLKNMTDFCQEIQVPQYSQLLGKILQSLSETQISSQMKMQQQKLDEKKKRKFFGLGIRFSIDNYIKQHKSLQGLGLGLDNLQKV